MRDINYYKEIIDKFSQLKVLVVGDVMLDKFIWGTVSRISPEAPVPVVKIKRESSMPGGAANVVANLASLGAKCYLAGFIGHDFDGKLLCDYLKNMKVNIDGIIKDKKRNTTVKTRIIANNQQVVRVDKEKSIQADKELNFSIFDFIQKNIDIFDIIIIEDYGKGVISSALLKKIISLAKKNKKPIAVDPKEENFHLYKGVTVITPNHHEAGSAVGIKIKDNISLSKAGRKLLKKLSCDAVLITRGEDGMSLFEQSSNVIHIPTAAQEVFDVSGAGDTVIAAFSLSLSAGSEMKDAAFISNIAGGIVVGKIGVADVKPDELITAINLKLKENILCEQLV